MEKIKETIVRILQANPNGRTLRQLQEVLRMQNNQFSLTELKIKEVLDHIATVSSSLEDPSLQLYRLKD